MHILNQVFEDFLLVEHTNAFQHAQVASFNFDVVKTEREWNFVIRCFEATDEEEAFLWYVLVDYTFQSSYIATSDCGVDLSDVGFDFIKGFP